MVSGGRVLMYPNYESYSKSRKEQEFHKQRIIFVIKNEEVFTNKHTSISHEEWFKELGWDVERVMENNVRGYYDGKDIYCYRGYDFREPDYSLIACNLDEIINKLEISDSETRVYSGVVVGEIGEKWKPRIDLGTIDEVI